MKTPKIIIPEREIQRTGIEIMAALGWLAFRRNVGAIVSEYNGKKRLTQFGQKGMADTWAIMPNGCHAEIEFKATGKRPTPEQLAWLMGTNGIGGSMSFWVDSTDKLVHVIQLINAGSRIVYRENGDYVVTR
jgi:hypothetical protein